MQKVSQRYVLYTVQSSLAFLVLYYFLINRCHGGSPFYIEYIIYIYFILLNDLHLNFPKYLRISFWLTPMMLIYWEEAHKLRRKMRKLY